MTPPKLRERVLAEYASHGRHELPWRTTRDPYRILVSEVMLQQTQVERVIPYYHAFLERFPNVTALSGAPLSAVLKAWQGLGYNRRAKMLHEAAKAVVREHGGVFPTTEEALRSLPGVGPYTAGAVAAFAYNTDVLIIETNIRTVVTHHCFSDRDSVSDAEVLEVLKKAHPSGDSRTWYWALMDYGSRLKRSGVRINAKRKGYTKQTSFSGSDRQARGALLRELAKGPSRSLIGILGDDRKKQVQAQLTALMAEGLIEKRGSAYRLKD